ncbi:MULTISPECIES: GntR family transcriptional regulator [Anaerotruncus]|uniref:GntR family transcriptional regulator n=1 Tax=Anaerotruncus TaxID=244127 RepID=UPI00082FAF3C|nr:MULTISPECIES: GntR family transcriptional regulator [Anaerotruncus]RGX54224.1 GntR family transcriptional regulator [Anaerotruncus sp. AF02-27]
MNIIISNASARPLYEQIEEQIKNEILAGNLTQGEPLPSIRYLARELKVSIITTKRAYDDLEADGFLTTTPGKGTFVSLANLDRLREVAMSQIEAKLSEAVDAAKSIGLRLEELQEITETLFREET